MNNNEIMIMQNEFDLLMNHYNNNYHISNKQYQDLNLTRTSIEQMLIDDIHDARKRTLRIMRLFYNQQQMNYMDNATLKLWILGNKIAKRWIIKHSIE